MTHEKDREPTFQCPSNALATVMPSCSCVRVMSGYDSRVHCL